MVRLATVTVVAAATLGSGAARAATVNASSCDQVDVQAAIDAAVDGDVVQIPAGSCIWTVPVTLGEVAEWQPIVYAGKAIVLQGAGAERTVIHIDMDSSEDALVVTGEAGKPFRITAMGFQGGRNEGRCQRAVVVGGDAEDWRVDHLVIDFRDVSGSSPGCGIGARGSGVIDHCRFEDVYTGVASFGDGDDSWQRPLALGSVEAVYIEDNVFNNSAIVGDGATDAYGGARYVFRHNTITNARAGHHGLDSGGYRSPHSWEIYDNTFNWTVPNTFYTWRSRGGTGVIFGNVIQGDGSETATFGVVNYRTCCCHLCDTVDPPAYGSSCEPFVACADPLHDNCGQWGRCDGNAPIDGNTPGMDGYPCMDQTGRSSDSDGDGEQDLEPLYAWDNTVNGNPARVTVSDPWGCDSPAMADHIQEGRDFYNDTPRPGYTPFTYPHPLVADEPAAEGSEDGGCGCRLRPAGRSSAALAAFGVGLLLWLRRRRRASSRRAWL